MALQHTDQLKNLKSAFQTFNEMSEQLMSSYHQLESKVDHLNQELASVYRDYNQQSDQNHHLVNRFERLLNALPGGVIVLSGKGMVQEANAAAVELFGEPLKGELWREVICRVFGPRADDGHDISLKNGRRVSISTSSLVVEPGQILLITDVTEKRQLQDKLGHFQRLSAMGEMAASLAHQIRTPAASALLYLSNLRLNCANTEAVVKYSDKIHEQLNNIETMVSDVLAYVKNGNHSQLTMFTTQTLVAALERSVNAQFERTSSQLIIDNNAPVATLRGNREALLGALVNLVMNAVHAAGQSPLMVTVSIIAHDAETISITVTDNGTGIPDDIKQNVFEPFFTTRPQGTGLGLAVVRSVIAEHGGRVALESNCGKGTCVEMLLPVYRFEDENSHQESKSEVWG